MRIFYLLLKRDFFLGLDKIKKSFLLLLSINLLIFIFPIYFYHAYMPGEFFSFWDIIGKNIGGIPIKLVEEKVFEFPYAWLLLQLCIITIIGNYIKDDLLSHSSFVRIRAKSIWKLWISKIIFCLITAIIFYIFLFGITYFVWRLSGHITTQWTTQSENIVRFTKLQPFSNQLVLYSILINFGGTIFITSLYSTLSLIMRTVYSYIFCVSLLFLSIFSNNVFFLGNESMLMRQPLFGENIISSIYICLIIQFILSVICIILGGAYLSKLEILGDTNEE
ncbi:hypothetical protein CN520_24445 [Bacillus cereus]|jgi:hypothetical protein|uniref:hypothetical protein n=1 Tax=Bacillus cereus TaxID=1396 RepID=UPI000BF86BE2|nr:hypothetical protein [Bacillus cereus]PET37892.1 hypothetical protein CN520_24445 [Bacillus cereus]PEY79072.1 hypothetical protein CN344_10520 [Bacillus cereus]PFW12853.1 hypothetical protein COL12_03095 [Bacillus cereus]PGP76263.1 hypothetical protein CN999_28090 [Bacillus cereus]